MSLLVLKAADFEHFGCLDFLKVFCLVDHELTFSSFLFYEMVHSNGKKDKLEIL